MKVFVTRCGSEPDAWRDHEETLCGLWASSNRLHSLTKDPQEADIIVITDLRQEDGYAQLKANPLLRKHADKCFAVYDGDFPNPLLRGIYTSISNRTWFSSRFRSGSYGLYHRDFKNPYIENHPGMAYDMEKSYLYCFAGRISHPVRSTILNLKSERPDIISIDTSGFNLFTHDGVASRVKDQDWFGDILVKSKFSLCPRGAGTSSIRLFETMKIGVAPVILSDEWIFPKGLNWSEFSIIIKEKDADKLVEIVASHESRFREMGAAAQKAYEDYFSEAAYFNYLVGQCAEIMSEQRVPESFFWKLRHGVVLVRKLKSSARVLLRRK
ncbi:MAG: exostosin family protein [Luteolibacter sp.]